MTKSEPKLKMARAKACVELGGLLDDLAELQDATAQASSLKVCLTWSASRFDTSSITHPFCILVLGAFYPPATTNRFAESGHAPRQLMLTPSMVIGSASTSGGVRRCHSWSQ